MHIDAMQYALRSMVQFVEGNVTEGRRLAQKAAEIDYINPEGHFKVREMISQNTIDKLYKMVS